MKTLNISFLMSLFLLSVSCRSTDSDNKTLTTGPVVINVGLLNDDYEDASGKNIQASNNQTFFSGNNLTQRKEVSFSKDFDLVAELKPDIQSLKSTAQAALNPIAAAPIQRVIKFRVVVYNDSGQYDSSYIYSVNATGAVTPDSGTPINLNGGQNYTFIAYSYNTNVAPNENLTGTNLSTASFTISSPKDFMYYKVNMTPSGEPNAQNNLNIVLKHSFSTITINVDSSLANGYNITNIAGATLGKSYSTATIALSSGVLTSTGTAGTVNVNFPGILNSSNVVATDAVVVNNTTNLNDGTFNMSSLTVGPLTGTNVAFNNLRIQPGVRYTLTLTLTPKDAYLSHIGQSAVRIGGVIWMRHNLGADTSLDPDQNPTVLKLNGNYYQWGRFTPAATSTDGDGPVSGWNTSTVTSSGAWNTGTESNPRKTINDPCPEGYRIPTRSESDALFANTVQSADIGNWTSSGINNYSAAVFRSKRDKNIQLTIPAAGSRNNARGVLGLEDNARRGVSIYMWTSTNSTSDNAFRMRYGKDSQGTIAVGKNNGMTVRCVAENSQ